MMIKDAVWSKSRFKRDDKDQTNSLQIGEEGNKVGTKISLRFPPPGVFEIPFQSNKPDLSIYLHIQQSLEK